MTVHSKASLEEDGHEVDREMELARLRRILATMEVAHAVEVAQLTDAVASRKVIGQATGLVMSEFSLTADAAFEVLRRRSQQRNLKVRDLADSMVEEGRSWWDGPAQRRRLLIGNQFRAVDLAAIRHTLLLRRMVKWYPGRTKQSIPVEPQRLV